MTTVKNSNDIAHEAPDRAAILDSIDELIDNIFEHQEDCTDFDLAILRSFLIYFSRNMRRLKQSKKDYVLKVTWHSNKSTIQAMDKKTLTSDNFVLRLDRGKPTLTINGNLSIIPDISAGDDVKIINSKTVEISCDGPRRICVFR